MRPIAQLLRRSPAELRQARRIARSVMLSRRLQVRSAANALRPFAERLGQIVKTECALEAAATEVNTLRAHACKRLYVGRTIDSGGVMNIERAVQINAMLNRKRALVAAERFEVQEQLQSITSRYERARAAENGAEQRCRAIAGVLAAAKESVEASEHEERRVRC